LSRKCIIDNTENERKANRKQFRPKKKLHDATTARRKAEVNHIRADKHKHTMDTMLHSMHVVAHLGFGLAPHIQLLHTQRNVTGKALSTYPVDTLESGPCNPLIFPKFLHDANPGLLHTRTTTHLPHNSLACLLACSLSLTTTSTFALLSHQKNASQIKQNKITPDFFVIFFLVSSPPSQHFPHTNQ
jgi:hypothetical protein